MITPAEFVRARLIEEHGTTDVPRLELLNTLTMLLQHETGRRRVNPLAPEYWLPMTRGLSEEDQAWIDQWTTPVTDSEILRIIARTWDWHPDFDPKWEADR